MFRLQMTGLLGADAQIVDPKENQNFEPFVKLSIAHTEEFANKSTGEINKKTMWFNCTGDYKYLNERVPKLQKGVLIFVEGGISNEIYFQEKEIDGKKKKIARIDNKLFITKLEILNRNTSSQSNQNKTENQFETEEEILTDVPF